MIVAPLLLASAVLLVANLALASTFTVDSPDDRVDSNIGNGLCSTSAGTCTLRAAIQETNALSGHDTIQVPAGVYELGIPTVNDDLPSTGDLDVSDTLTINGVGDTDGDGEIDTIVDGGLPLPSADPDARGIDRLFEIHPTSGNVTFSKLTLQEGFSADDGAAVQNWSPGLLRLDTVHVLDNLATGVGGGINNAEPSEYEWVVEPLNPPKSGRVEIVNSTLSGNASGGGGAAVNNSGTGSVSILSNSKVVNNPGEMIPDPQDPEEMIPGDGVYAPDASAIANQGALDTVGTLRIADSTVSGNYAEHAGGGVANMGSGTLTIERSTITDNTTEAQGGGVYSAGGKLTVTGGTFSANHAQDGAGIYSGGANDVAGLRSRVAITGSTVKDNIAAASGGGIYSGGEAQVAITDVAVSENTAGDAGGGLRHSGRASLVLTRGTFTGNITNNEGGGAWTGSERLVTIKDSTFTKNKAGVPEMEDGIPEPGDALSDPSANIAGGGGLYTESGAAEISQTKFTENTATDEGGGLSLDNHGDVKISDSEFRANKADTDGGGLENSGTRVTFERLLVTGNRAELDGGGIYNSSSGPFTILDTTVEKNNALSGGGLANAPDNDLIVKRSLFLRNTARHPGISEDGDPEDGGLGGGIYSLADGDSQLENTTISGNVAAKGGGGIFHDADGLVKLTNLTIWRNSAPRGGGIGVVESDFSPPIPPKANVAVIVRNTIVGGSLKGGSCDWYVTSEGGNLDTGGLQDVLPSGEGPALPPNTACFLSAAPDSDSAIQGVRDRRSATFTLDAIADNGGETLTHALNWGSLAIDSGNTPCPETDQRGVERPQNGKCDTGAFEFEGPPPPIDNQAPDTEYISGPIQDSFETVAFQFTGTDEPDPNSGNKTSTEELQYECRLLENDPAEPQEPLAPWDPIPPEFWWVGCQPGWQAPLLEEGMFTFEVRAIDRAGNVDETPATRFIGGDTTAPDTIIDEKPPLVSNSRVATFTFSGTDNITPPQFMEFECRLDSRDPELWLECLNPTIFTNLTSGEHTLEVRALDGAELMDPSPARYKWTVGQLPNCDQANITLTAAADGWVDQVNPLENYLFETELTVRSGSTGDPTAVPPEPVVGQNARALTRFALPTDDGPNCVLESAKLRLYNESPTEGRTLEAVPLAGPFKESTLTWSNQPGTNGSPVATDAHEGYQEWNVLEHVQSMTESGVNHGWQIRDANENDADGGDQAFMSREMPQDPPPATLPQLVLRYEADTAPPPAPPTPATEPTTVHCGQVLKESTLVANDLLGCPGEGLVVGAPNIVVDLNGHTITSAALIEPGEEDGLLAGIRNSGKTNVVIRNGTVKGYGYGVLLTGGTTRNVVEEMTLDANLLAGIELNDADDGRNGNTIRNNLLTSNGEAAMSFLNGSENSVITGNTLDGNGGVAFQLIEADGHRFENNTVSGIPIDPLIDSDAGASLEGSSENVFLNNTFHDFGDAGLILTAGSARNLIQGNELVRSGDAGVAIQDSPRNQVIDNVAHASSDGGVVVNSGNDTVVRGNDVRFNPNGVDSSNSNNLVIEDNDGSDSQQTGFEIGNGLNIKILNNTANRTGGAGIAMEGGAFDANGSPVGGALIRGNTANENLENGIVVADGGHTIADNNAHNNAGFGIEAGENPEIPGQPFPGTNIDGGNNKATGNGELEQCAGVVCITGDPVTPSEPDTSPPDTSIVESPLTPTSSDTAKFKFSADDGPNGTPLTAMVFECRLDPPPDPEPEPEEPDTEPPHPNEPPDPVDPVDPGNWLECTNPMLYHGLQEGEHHFEVRARDHSDNVDLSPATFDWDIDPTAENEEDTGPDSTPPNTRIASGPDAETTSKSATFRFAGSDNATPGLSLKFECRLDDGIFESCTTPKSYDNLSEGSHTFEVRAIDRTGNVDQSPASHNWTVEPPPVDATAPDTTIGAGPDQTTVRTDATFEFSANEPGSRFECSLNGAAFAECASPKEYTGLAVGDHEFRVRAVDQAGNTDLTPATYTWAITRPPVAAQVFCGQKITRSTLVRNDLNNCLGDGLVVGADRITIDLNGHTIDGTGLGAGIRNDGYDFVTVTNGSSQSNASVVDFDYGVMLNTGAARNIVESLTLERNQEAGIALGNPPPPDPLAPNPPEEPPPGSQSGVDGNILRNNNISANDLGIWLTNGAKDNSVHDNALRANGQQGVWIERSSNNRVESNEITGSGDFGVALQGATANTVADNTLEENGGGVLIGVTELAPAGLPSVGNHVERNTIIESGGAALEVDESHENELIDNEAHGANGGGIHMEIARDNLARGNDLRSNKSGITLKNSSGNRLENNDVSESDGTGISLEALSLNNELVGNTANTTLGDGIYVGDAAAGGSGMLIERNTTNNNASDGIYIPKPSHTITGNVSHDNAGWGIWAGPESSGRSNVDGGGNRAQGNLGGMVDPLTSRPEQCFGIRCEGSGLGNDQVSPDTLILEGPADPSSDSVATFRFNGTDNASKVTFQCRLDPQEHTAFTACTSPHTLTGLSPAEHTFEVRAVDVSGNADDTAASHTWTYEPPPATQPPETTINSGPDRTTVRTDATFEFSANERASTFECKLDAGSFESCASPQPYTGLAEGAHELQVRATDTDGNTETTPATYAWTIGPPPVAANVECGEFITQSTLLKNDLINCPGHGIIIGAANITVDLDGHIIDGTGVDTGVLNNGHDSVTVTNGTVHEFDYGVQLNPGTGGNVLSSLRVELNQEAGIALSDADESGNGNIVRNNTVLTNGFGIALFSGTRNSQVLDNDLNANTHDGVRVNHSVGNRVENNKITLSGGAGIILEGGNTNTVVGNTLRDNKGYGVAVGEELLPSNTNRIAENTVIGGAGGISVDASTGNEIVYNVVHEATGPGLAMDLARDTFVRGNDLGNNVGGIQLSESSGNRLEANNASGSMGTGIDIGVLSGNNQVVLNTASSNLGEGIEVVGSATVDQGNLIERNTANSNGGDGILVETVGHTLTGNVVRTNGAWGIYVAASAIDGGGNKAAGNVEPDQCFNIKCEISTIPGAPETVIIEHPPSVSNSRNASFTYTGRDEVDPLNKLVFECRFDSDDPLAWEDCEYPAEFLNLSAGEHTFEVRAVDTTLLADPTPARYTWTYEPLPANDAPETTIDLTPEAESWSPDALFTFHANEPDVDFECKVDNNPYEPCGFVEPASHMSMGAFEWSLIEETEAGLHTFSVRATDFEGNVGEPATYTWRLLGIMTVFLDGPGFMPAVGGPGGDPATGSETLSSDATIKFEANVADATFECSLDLEPFAPCTSPVTYTGLGMGEHLLQVIATDPDGISQLEAAEYEWEVAEFNDTEPPNTSIERAPANNSSSTIFEFTGTDNQTPPELLTYECRVDSTSELDWQACTSPFNLLDVYTYQDFEMAPGPHTFEVRAIDAAEPEIVDPTNPNFEGNPDPTPATYTWTMTEDTTAPGTGIVSGPAAKTGETEATFEFMGSDNATPDLQLTYECALDGAEFEPCDSPHSVSGLEPGEHTLQVRTLDLVGNRDATPATRTWTVVPSPVTRITSGPTGRIVDGQAPPSPSTTEDAIFVFSADQAGSTFECSLDGADFLPCTSPHAYWIVENGTHEFEVRATNPEGVVEEPPARYEWAVELGPDTREPETRITSAPDNPDGNTVATFEFTGSDNRTPTAQLSYECALDGTAYNSCTSPQQFSDLTRGQHVLLVRSKDAAGNFDRTPARYEWTVAPPPVTTITSGPADTSEETMSRDARFTFSADVPGSTFQCWLDGKLEPCTSPKEYTNLGYGDHYFAVLATNPAGVVESEWVEYEWTILPPIARLDSVPATSTDSSTARFEFSSPDPDAKFQCSLDGRTFVSCASPKEYQRLWPGIHRFEVQAVYPNMAELGFNPVPVSHEWTIVDNEPPDTSIEFGPPNNTASTDAFIGFNTEDPTAIVECSLDGEPFGECEPPIAEYTELPVGEHTFTAQAVDPAGNIDPTPATYTWTITDPPANNTPVGANVTVEMPMPNIADKNAAVTFTEVTTAGATWIDALDGGPSMPNGYALRGGSIYDVGTTAEFGQPVTLCLGYDPASFSTPAVRLLEFDGSTWTDVTMLNNPNTGRVCGEIEDFMIFAVASASSGVAPETSIISGPPNPSSNGSATFEFFADQPDSMTQCSINGEPFVMCESPVTYTHLDEGGNDFQVQAINAEGHLDLTPALYEWEVVFSGPDTEAPDTTITRGPPATTGSYYHNLEFTGSDDRTAELDLEFECTLDGEALGSCSSPHEFEVLTAGEHTIEVSAIDVAGNVDPTPATRTFKVVDVTAPETVIDLGPDSETEASTATFEFSAQPVDPEVELDPNTTFQCSFDNADFTDCTSPHTVENVSLGSHVFEVRAKDAAGNADPTPDFYEWIRLDGNDTTPPDTFIVHHPPANSGPDVTFGFSSNEPVEEFECMLDGGPWESCEPLHELLGLARGEHTIQVRAMDLAVVQNVDPTPASFTWTVLGEPDTTITSGPEDLLPDEPGIQTNRKSATFEFTSDQEGATFQCSINGSAFIACTSPYVAGPLAEDTQHQFEVRAVNQFRTIDGERVVDLTPASFEWTVQDATPPETTLSSVTYLGRDHLTDPNSLRFEFTGSDNRTNEFELAFECSLDGEAFSGCDSPYFLALDELQGGEHTFEIRAMDNLDNVDPTPAKHTFRTDGVPDTTVETGPDAQTDSREATFTFSSDLAGATFMCSLDGSSFTACESPHTYTDVPYGEHEFLVQAVSPGGDIDPEPASYTWESGHLTAPEATILSGPTPTSGPEVTTESTSATFTFNSEDPDAQFQCSLDGAAPTFCNSPKEYTGLQPGVAHTFEVQATKPHLLVESEPAVWEWMILDNAAPETTITKQPANPSAETVVFEFRGTDNGTPAAELTFECALDSEPFAGCSSPRELQNLAAGEHTLQVRATDSSLNVEQTPASYTWTVVAPPATTVTGPESPSASSSATLEFFDQPGSTYECALDEAAFEPCSSPKEYTNLADGDHRFQVRATNSLGVVEQSPAEHVWTVAVPDTTAPDTTFDLKPPATTTNTSATFAFAGSDNRTPAAELSFECALDGEPFAGCSSPHELQNLAVGQHTLEVRAIDLAGNVDETPASYTWTITEPPANNTPAGTDVRVELPMPDGAGNATVTFAEVTAAGFTELAALDSGSSLPADYFQAGALFYDVSTTAQFTQPVTVCLTYDPNSFSDPVRLLHYGGGNWTDITTSIDEAAGQVCGAAESLSPFAIAAADPNMAPQTTVLRGPDSTTVSTEATFAFAASDPRAEFECALDTPQGEQPSWGSCPNPVTYNGLAVGAHELLVRAIDEFGKVDLTPARYQWRIEPLPESTIDSGPKDLTDSNPDIETDSTEATFTFSSDQPGATFECRLDTAGYEPCTSPVTYSDLAFEEHTFFVRAKDAAGNVDPTPAEYQWEIGDFFAPETTIDSGPNATTTSTDARFAFSANEPNASFECSLDGGNFNACSSPRTYTGLALGKHEFSVRATDPAGNVDQTPASYTWTVEAPPCDAKTVAAGANADAWISQGSPSANKGTDSILKVRSKGSVNLRALVKFPLASIPQGCQVESATLRTYAGSAVTGRTLQALQISGSWSEGGVTWNNRPATTGTAATTASGLGWREWEVTSQVKAMYTSGNNGFLIRDAVEGQDHEQQFHSREKAPDQPPQLVIRFAPPPAPDTTAPDTTITDKPADPTQSNSATFGFAGTDNKTAGADLTFRCRLDSQDWGSCSSPQGYTSLAVGSHTFEVSAVDQAGNTDQTPAIYTWTVEADTSAPETTVDSGPNATTTSTDARFAFSANESNATFECSLDGATFAACASPKDYTALALGAHEFSVRATDPAGNVDQTPAIHTWTVEAPTCAPQTVTSGANADAWVGQGSPSNNNGTDSILKVRSKGSVNARALVKFPLASIPQGCQVESVTLRMYAGSAVTGRTLQALQISGIWSEGGVTWNNQPATTGAAATIASGLGWRGWDVTSQVKDMYATGVNNGFLIRDAVEGKDHEQQFHSREKAPDQPPELVIRFS